ncbi:hypothetical protein V8B55DRAFT_1480778 [Mucor lusitanicus]|uniref:Uncharacterized protein n=1 Tax=Mucor circinelloides f. lusitanicus TaxID=29924 RepID=A0A8H4BI60_MUCCL|nr:hypothetical protein FB192DRAFT_1378554 [Mucor lusitanicus]
MIQNITTINANGVLSLRPSGLEVLLMETTGKLTVEDKPKEVRDYVKAGYDPISMLHNIGHQYPYANFQIFKKLCIFLQLVH